MGPTGHLFSSAKHETKKGKLENNRLSTAESDMEEVSMEPRVPAVSQDPKPSSAEHPPEPGGVVVSSSEVAEMDKDLLCPICMQIIKDAFLTACGHSFCYMCIITHLRNKSDCPCCAQYLINNQLFPNFLLDKVCFNSLSNPLFIFLSQFF